MSSSRERQRVLDVVENIEAINSYVEGMDSAAFAARRSCAMPANDACNG